MRLRTALTAGALAIALAGGVAVSSTVASAQTTGQAQQVLQLWKAEGTISPVGHKGWCLTTYSLSPNASLWWEPCEPIGNNANQLWTALQVKIKGLPAGVLAITTFTVPPPNVGYSRLCVGGVPYNGNQASLFDCSEHLDARQGIYIYGGPGTSNRLRNLKAKWITFWGGYGPVNWEPRNTRIKGHKPVLAFKFNGELTGNGWEVVEAQPPSWFRIP